MCRKHLQITFAFIFFLIAWPSAQAFTTLPPGPKPIPVETGLYINDILGLVESNETMTFVGTLTLRWRDKRLAFNPEDVGTREKNFDTHSGRVALARIWYPQIELLKGRGPRQVQMLHLTISDMGVVTLTEKFLATTEVHMDLRHFPFDKQVVEVALRPFADDAALVQLKNLTEFSGVSKNVDMQGWILSKFVTGITTVDSKLYQTPFSQYNLMIQYNRISTYYIFQVFIPIMLIVLLSFSVFWMVTDPLVNRVAISLTAVLTIVVFEWRIASKLPRVNYHMFADAFMLTSFVIAASTILATLFLGRLEQQRKKKYLSIFRIGYPILYLIAVAVVGVYFL